MKYVIGLMVGLILSMPQAMAASYSFFDDDMPDAMQHMVKAPNIDFANLRDPFASYLVRIVPRGQHIPSVAATLPHSQMLQSNREREKLEQFDLDTLRLVGIFSMGGERVAMIEDSQAKGYIIRRGNYVGKHNGQIEKITDHTIFLVEEVLNPAGDVIDRQVSLTLNEINE